MYLRIYKKLYLILLIFEYNNIFNFYRFIYYKKKLINH